MEASSSRDGRRELRAWQQLLLLDFSSVPADDTAEGIIEWAQLRSDLLCRARSDRTAVDTVNLLCPHWPPLRLKSDMERASEDVRAASSHQAVDPDKLHWVCMGLDPDLPWDSFFSNPNSVLPALSAEMYRQRSASLLSFCLESRIASEQILLGSWSPRNPEEATMASVWLSMKAELNGSSLSPSDRSDLPTVLKEEMDRLGRRAPPATPLLQDLADHLFSLTPPNIDPPPSQQLERLGRRHTRRGTRGKRTAAATAQDTSLTACSTQLSEPPSGPGAGSDSRLPQGL
jgi:hypothetical protein